MKSKSITITASFLFAVLGLSSYPLKAQQNSRINPRVEVQRDYEARIMETTKPKLSFAIPDSISKFNIAIEYAIFDKPYLDLYSFTPLPSVHLSTHKAIKQPWTFIRIGSAWQTSPEADLFIQAPLSGMSALLLTAQHRSFWGELPRYQHDGKIVADQMHNKADARYALNWDKGRFEIGGGYNYNYHTYYGIAPMYPEADFNSRAFMRDSMSHNWAIYRADLSISSLKTVQSGTEWGFSFGWSLLEDKARLRSIAPIPTLRESLIRFRGDLGVRINPEQIFGFTLYGSFSNTLSGNELDRGIFAMNPYYQFNKERFALNAGVVLSGAHNYDNESEKINRFFLYPKIEASYQIIPANLLIYANIRGENRHNNYQTLLTENPWLSQDLDLRSSSIPWDIRAGFKGKIAAHFGYNLYGQYLKTDNQYYSSTKYLDNRFDLYYANEERLSAVAEFSLNTTPLTLNITGKYHSYTLDSGGHAWYKPNVEAHFAARYQWRERIIASANIACRGEVFARHEFSGAPSTKIDGYADIGLSLEYRFASWFGIYAEGKNLLNMEKQYYLFYNEPGIRIGGGVTFRF